MSYVNLCSNYVIIAIILLLLFLIIIIIFHSLQGEERAYILSKARRLWREEQLLHAALEQGRVLEPEEVPTHLVSRLLRGVDSASTAIINPTFGALDSSGGCSSLPRVATEEEDENGGKSRSRDDASAAAQYVVEEMRYDVFVIMRDLLALSSS